MTNLLHSNFSCSAITHDIHFWLGEETSQDEAGIAAYKTVELDEGLGGGPVQYREVQGNESSAFLALFKKSGGLEYLPGGVESGFRHVDRDSYTTRLLMVKGKRTVRVREVPLSNASLNTGDVFILDTGLKIFVYNGATANRHEKAKGIDVANKIRNEERGGRAEIFMLDEDPNNSEFWTPLGGQITVTNPGEPDAHADASPSRLFQVSDANGFTEVALHDNRLKRDLLSSDDVFIVDVGNKLYVWVGKKASASERRESMAHAMQYIAQNGYPNNTPIERVSDGGETPTFKAEFVMWNPPQPLSFGARPSSGVAATQADKQLTTPSPPMGLVGLRVHILTTPFAPGLSAVCVLL
ncbi:Gel [Symbiodinium microadriaticum]|nr:Gel [Symbiodinium microadriaticum]